MKLPRYQCELEILCICVYGQYGLGLSLPVTERPDIGVRRDR